MSDGISILLVRGDLEEWCARSGETLCGDMADLLLSLLGGPLNLNHPAELSPDGVTEFLLEVFPFTVPVNNPDHLGCVIRTLRLLVAYVEDQGRISAAEAGLLRQAIDDAEPQFADAVADPTRWGPERTALQMMLADAEGAMGVLDAVVSDDVPPKADAPLPASSLPPEAELAARARRCATLVRAHRLSEWVCERKPAPDGGLLSSDTVTAARVLEIELPHDLHRPDLRQVPALAYLWDIALAAGLLEIDDGTAAATQATAVWTDLSDERVLGIWQAAFTQGMAHGLVNDAEIVGRNDLDFTGSGIAVTLLVFYARDRGLEIPLLRDYVVEDATKSLPPNLGHRAIQSWISSQGHPLDTLLARLTDLDAIEVTGDLARITPLGTWRMRQLLIESGDDLPLLPPIEQMTAAHVVDLYRAMPSVERDAVIKSWRELRTVAQAGRELLEVAAVATPHQRKLATELAMANLEGAEQPWRAALAIDTLRPYAKVALTRILCVDPQNPPAELRLEFGDMAWIWLDAMCRLDDEPVPGELQREFAAVAMDTPRELLHAMGHQRHHPEAARVLTRLAAELLDDDLAEAAREAADAVRNGG